MLAVCMCKVGDEMGEDVNYGRKNVGVKGRRSGRFAAYLMESVNISLSSDTTPI